jgi:hypothetical protein
MSTNNTDSLLVSIEREHQRLRQRIRWLTFGLVLTLALLLLGEALRWLRSSREASTAAPGELRATRFVITDKEGRVRAELGLAPDEREPQLVFYHPDGQRWAALAIATPPGAPESYREAGLFLLDETGKTRVSLGASAQDSGLVLYDAEGTPGLSLYAAEDAQGLVISGGNVPRIHLRYNQHDDGQLSELVFQDEQKRTQAVLRGGRGGVSLNFYRADGERTFQAP